VRRLFAADQVWTVREMPAPYFDRRGGTHLIFESDQTMNRVRHFPKDWHTLSDDDLYALTDRRRTKRDET
jgi:hypothetical protein